MGTAANVLIGANGRILDAPSGTTLVTDATTGLDAAFIDVGYISDDGLTEHLGTTTNKIKNWEGSTVREVQTEHELTYKFVMIETNDESQRIYYGSDPADGIEAVQGVRGSWALEVFDGDVVIRVIVPDGQVTARGDVLYRNDQATAREVTISCYPDDTNKKAYVYRDDGS